MTTNIEWMHYGVGRGKGAVIIDDELNHNAILRFIVELKNGELKLPENTEVLLWCGSEHFKFLRFDSEFEPWPPRLETEALVFSAECEKDGLVRFMWKSTPSEEDDSGRYFVDSISLWKP